MKYASALTSVALLFGIALGDLSLAGPVTREEAQRQALVLEQLTKSVADEKTDEGRFALITRMMTGEDAVMVRRKVLEVATRFPGLKLDEFLARVLAMDEDAGVRSEAATALGKFGSEKQLGALADAAKNDRTTNILIGDIGGKSNARRAATFAIAELTARFPKLADEVATKLRDLPVVEDKKDNEGLADARVQALYQITRDESLLKPFYERLKSKEAEVRVNGVVAFQFLKLKTAPAEIVAALKDDSLDVRSWAALILGRINDPKTAEVLMTAAGDAKEDNSVRCNAVYSLGLMKSAAAAPLMEKLLTDPEPGIQANAAVALYRITGKKVKQFPEGYNAD
jgi:HEAT repeat protein